jgi:hypothetical protein
LASSEVTPQEISRFPAASSFISDEQLVWASTTAKSKPQPLLVDSLFPTPPLFSS